MFLFYVLSFFKKGDTIQGGTFFKWETLFKDIRQQASNWECKTAIKALINYLFFNTEYCR